MPCFKGLAVSIHTPDGPLPEHSIQKQSRAGRINAYIPVPPAKIPENSTSNIPEQSTFAISITLLTPGLSVPYSTPKPTEEDPYPRSKVVGGLPGSLNERGKYGGVIGPYVPITSSVNETIAAYIYFDGRTKEEVATLLRRGEETWVNSRWVSVPEEEGGGLAEREFLFREVGLERWLNGLDLQGQGKEVAERLARRRDRLEKRRRKLQAQLNGDEDLRDVKPSGIDRNGVLVYGSDKQSPVQTLSTDGTDMLSSDSDSDDEPPMPEAAGQIKIALFRVLASGEIKRGEYSPQFDAHDDDDAAADQNKSGEADADADHTTGFAKPKTLDPKSISTQTVTGMDPVDKPYAVFTFLYRGEKQLRKMGILSPAKEENKTPASIAQRKSIPKDFSTLGPLHTFGTVGFAGYRDSSSKKNGKFKIDDDEMDSDNEDDDLDVKREAAEEINIKEEDKGLLSPEDAAKQEKLAEGVRQIKLKRAHSAEPDQQQSSTPSHTPPTHDSETPGNPVSPTPQLDASWGLPDGTRAASLSAAEISSENPVGSPYKRQRPSLPGTEEEPHRNIGGIGDVLSRIEAAEKANGHQASKPPPQPRKEPTSNDDDEEL
ncbi:hypothetical protein EV356DRAFT_523206 [Viridothelium virens]|uniref:DUF7918 domain-containing protein n=1 Tax=Viridothelium virens TaxID=1048519 RepID=A0A6A6HCC4_VIRVR|nr:hypothetical protein EV356DRAFT_523206 [Viridothelium virens]